MYCKYCGTKVNDAAVFCTNCGKQIRKLRAESGSMANGRPATASEKDVCEKPEVEDTVESIPTYFRPERDTRCSDSHNSRCCTKNNMELRTLDCSGSSKETSNRRKPKRLSKRKATGMTYRIRWTGLSLSPLSSVESLRENSKGLCWVVATTAFIYLNAMGVRG